MIAMHKTLAYFYAREIATQYLTKFVNVPESIISTYVKQKVQLILGS